MKCKIENCESGVMYKKDGVCQKHYFRKMRYGTYELTSKRKYRIQNPAGYQKIYEPNHVLSNKDGYVYEHRFIYHKKDDTPRKCVKCGTSINWKTLHIDHIDEDVTNNNIGNLRPLCRNCNTCRNRTVENLTKTFVDCRGLRLSVQQWARRNDVKVASATIKKRLLKGQTAEEAIFGERKTHKNTNTVKPILKYMKEIE